MMYQIISKVNQSVCLGILVLSIQLHCWHVQSMLVEFYWQRFVLYSEPRSNYQLMPCPFPTSFYIHYSINDVELRQSCVLIGWKRYSRIFIGWQWICKLYIMCCLTCNHVECSWMLSIFSVLYHHCPGHLRDFLTSDIFHIKVSLLALFPLLCIIIMQSGALFFMSDTLWIWHLFVFFRWYFCCKFTGKLCISSMDLLAVLKSERDGYVQWGTSEKMSTPSHPYQTWCLSCHWQST